MRTGLLFDLENLHRRDIVARVNWGTTRSGARNAHPWLKVVVCANAIEDEMIGSFVSKARAGVMDRMKTECPKET